MRNCASEVWSFGPSRNDGERSNSPLLQQILQIEPPGEHRQRAVLLARPLLLRPVIIQLDAVLVGIAQVKRLADAVVAGAIERNAGLDQSMQRVRQRGAG